MWGRRIIVLTVAVVITVVTLGFWTYFARVLGVYLSQPDQPKQEEQVNPNEVTVKIINKPAPQQPCDKAHPCPATPHG